MDEETKAEQEWQHKAKELEVTTSLMQDTGESIWLINAAYLVACTVLLSILVSGAFGDKSTKLELVASLLGAIVGVVFSWLWIASFERNYGFYILRINTSRMLERELGFKTLTYGKTLSDSGVVKNEQGVELSKISWIGRKPDKWGIQTYTRCLIGVFGVAFVSILIVALVRVSR